MAGYSGTPLWKKLGIEPGMTVALFNAPQHIESLLDGHPEGVRFVSRHPEGARMVICFATEADLLADLFAAATEIIPAHGAIWVSWPKKSSKVPTDITEDRLREMFLPTGLVDVKVCAVDDTWSGLKFMVRKENRDSWHD